MRIPIAVTAALAGAALVGCEPTVAPDDAATDEVVEHFQAHDRNLRTVDAYCRRRPKPRGVGNPATQRPPTKADALRAVAGLAEELSAVAGVSYENEYEERALIARLATRFEREECLADQVPKLDRWLRSFRLPEPTYEEEHDPDVYGQDEQWGL